MKKILMTAIVVSMSTAVSYAGGWGGGGSNSLVNVSPSVDLGNVTALNGILNGNNVSDILSGNQTGIGNGVGILGGIGTGIIGGNAYKLKKKH